MNVTPLGRGAQSGPCVGECCETRWRHILGLRSSRLNNPPFVIGGAGVYAAHVTEELATLGHQVIVFTPAIGNTDSTEHPPLVYSQPCGVANYMISSIPPLSRD